MGQQQGNLTGAEDKDRSSHTPGPWMVSASGPSVYALHGHPARNRFFALVQSGRADDASAKELMANARLIAAAPELLAVVRKLIEAADESESTLHFSEMVDRFIEEARAAIAKATGASHE